MPTPNTADIVKGAIAGLAAGLVASFAMDQFQALVTRLSSDDGGSDEEPTTVKAADWVARTATGDALPENRKEAAGNAVHYALGGALGLAYGVAAEFRPAVTTGVGSAFGFSTFLLLDEAAVPTTGLAPPPTETPPATHLYAAASHLVFGAVTEGVRLALRSLLGKPALR